MRKGDILRMLGAVRRRRTMDYVMPAIGIFAAGALIGGVAALTLTPRPGREVRRALREKASEIRHRLANRADEIVSEVTNRLPSGRDESENNFAGRSRKIAVKTT